MDFADKTVLITGASSGIGRQAAIEFAKSGARIILVARKREDLETVDAELKKLGVPTLVCCCDVSKEDQVQEMSKVVIEKFKTVDVLVNNAGFAIYGPVTNLSTNEIKSQMETNYFGMVHCVKAFLPLMLEKGSGHIVNVASLAASFGLPGIAPYCASKFAMLGFSEGIKHELKGTNVGITVVSPIMVRTRFFDHPSFEGMPKYSPTSLDPKTVARAILKASNSPRLEIVVPSTARIAVWLKHTFPYLINPIMGRSFRRLYSATKT